MTRNRQPNHSRLGAAKLASTLAALGLAATLLILVPGGFAQNSPSVDLSVTAGDDPNVETLTRGPVHEAYAEPGTFNAQQGPIVTKAPPAAIEEIPPDQKPEGDDVTWIPGYWSYDSDRDDFIWVSGIWRIPPPDRSWVPGYWSQLNNGYSWTPGFWMAENTDEISYLPQPPDSLEVGPSTPPPTDETIWTPGCWLWVDTHYAWRPGYWVAPRPDWIWCPSHYLWSPRGCVFVDGFWDHPFERRGVLFAPCYFHEGFYSSRRYYSPSVVITVGAIRTELFISPSAHHYYFGDYYDTVYVQRGYRPWFQADPFHRCYDPIFAHERWSHDRIDPQWGSNLRRDFNDRRDHPDQRPARTFAAMQVAASRAPAGDRSRISFAASITTVAARDNNRNRGNNNNRSNDNTNNLRFTKIDDAQRRDFGSQAKTVSAFRDERASWESKRSAPGTVDTVAVSPGNRGNDNSRGNGNGRGADNNGRGSDTAFGSNPNARGGNPNARGGNPNARGGNDNSPSSSDNNAPSGNNSSDTFRRGRSLTGGTADDSTPNTSSNQGTRGGGRGRSIGNPDNSPNNSNNADRGAPRPAVDTPASSDNKPDPNAGTSASPRRGRQPDSSPDSTPRTQDRTLQPATPSAGRVVVKPGTPSEPNPGVQRPQGDDGQQRVRIPRSPVMGKAPSAGSSDSPPPRPDQGSNSPPASVRSNQSPSKSSASDSPRGNSASAAPSSPGPSSPGPTVIDNSGRGNDGSSRGNSGSSARGGGGGNGRGNDRGN